MGQQLWVTNRSVVIEKALGPSHRFSDALIWISADRLIQSGGGSFNEPEGSGKPMATTACINARWRDSHIFKCVASPLDA
jgi:hypothetical protein